MNAFFPLLLVFVPTALGVWGILYLERKFGVKTPEVNSRKEEVIFRGDYSSGSC